MKKVTLYNVMDIRTGKVHSVVIVKAREARFFRASRGGKR